MRTSRWISVWVVVVLVTAGFVGLRGTDTTIVAHFPSATGLYPNDEVRVLGVKVGTVSKVEPQGATVKVTMTVEEDQPIPADAKAAIVAPSLVNGRFVQLTPVYDGGAKLGDGDAIPVERTAVPVSFDEVKQELTDLSTALATSETGRVPLAEAVTALEANLGDGTAERLAGSLESLRTAAEDLSEDRGDLFTTVDQLNTFTQTLVINDASLRGATQELATFAGTLDGSSEQLGATLSTLQNTLAQVTTFVDANRTGLTTSLEELVPVAETVANQSNRLAQILHLAPGALEGFYNTVENSAVTGRAQLANLNSTGELLCGLVLSVGSGAEACRQAVTPLFRLLNLEPLPISPGVANLTGETASPTTPAPAAPVPLAGLLGPLGLQAVGGTR